MGCPDLKFQLESNARSRLCFALSADFSCFSVDLGFLKEARGHRNFNKNVSDRVAGCVYQNAKGPRAL